MTAKIKKLGNASLTLPNFNGNFEMKVRVISASFWLQAVAITLIFIFSTLLVDLLNIKISFIFYLLFAAYCILKQSGKRRRFLSLLVIAP